MKTKPIDNPQYAGMRNRLGNYIRSSQIFRHAEPDPRDSMKATPGNPCVEGCYFHKECLNTPDRMCN